MGLEIGTVGGGRKSMKQSGGMMHEGWEFYNVFGLFCLSDDQQAGAAACI